MAFMCWVPPAWQLMQRALISFAEWSLKMKSSVLLLGPSTCAAAGPWQPWQPILAGSPAFSRVVFQCGDFSHPVYSSSWQVLQASAGAYLWALPDVTAVLPWGCADARLAIPKAVIRQTRLISNLMPRIIRMTLLTHSRSHH